MIVSDADRLIQDEKKPNSLLIKTGDERNLTIVEETKEIISNKTKYSASDLESMLDNNIEREQIKR